MKLSDSKIDIKKREEGAWISEIPGMGDLELKVRGSGNKDWARLDSKLRQAIPRQRRLSGMLEPDDLLRITSILIRDTSLLDWRNIENGDGTQEPYSKEAAHKYLTDPQYENFVWACSWAANVVAEKGKSEDEDDAKN